MTQWNFSFWTLGDLNWKWLSNILGHTKESPGQQWVSWGSRSIKKGERITLESAWAWFLAAAALRTRNQRWCPSGCWGQEVAVSIRQVHSCFHYYQSRWEGTLKRRRKSCSVFFSGSFFFWHSGFDFCADHRVKTHIPQQWVRWNHAKDCFAAPPSLPLHPLAQRGTLLECSYTLNGKISRLWNTQFWFQNHRFKHCCWDFYWKSLTVFSYCTYPEDETVLYC